ncbi:jg11014 [Pararge aegeria aegeria]|uniref:Jg11014 protein n=1 Tax=Pararge aegeria aegeria TaxID=348720 RepID=A0A8S4SBX9_9NEOP|nr:jg11014 [Pararge aegeria aegeria]
MRYDDDVCIHAFQRLLTVCCRSGKLGAASYTLQTGELQILEEIVDRPPEHQIFISLFNQMDPVKLILDGKSQSTFVNAVKRVVLANDTNQNTKCQLAFISAKEYNFEACKRRIYSLALPHEPANCSDEERIIFLRTLIDFSQTQTVHALGAMLRYLDLNWSNLIMDLHGKPQCLSLTRISLADIVAIDEDTYRGLQIFSSLSHPSGFKKGVHGSNKEGLSLYQLFSKCSSKVGHQRMKILMRHPTKDIETLRRRQDVVAYFMKPQSDSVVRNICASLRFIKNVNTLYNVVLICEICDNVGQKIQYLEQLANFDTNKLYEMSNDALRILLKKARYCSASGMFADAGVPDFYAELRKRIANFWETVQNSNNKLIRIIARASPENFQNNDYIHYKSRGCEELDVMIGDMYPEIVAHETRIMMKLTSTILANLHTLAAAIDKCAELDCLISISKVCKEYSFVKPTLTTDKVISIEQGKHPLCITTIDNFVPNDVECSLEAGYVKILTGPNSSGKSVYMKQIGLIVYLAHIGSFVPAESATIGIVSHIYSRIQSTECVAAHMSAFLIDLRQMSLAVREASSHSLVLADEFGKGTAQADGLALLAACLNTLLCRGAHCPHLLLSTHFLDLGDYIVDTPFVRFLRFEHVLQGGEPVFLFRVAQGAAERSFAHAVAEASGIDPRVVGRAKEVYDAMKSTNPHCVLDYDLNPFSVWEETENRPFVPLQPSTAIANLSQPGE